MVPVLARIIAQGKKEGAFHVPDAQSAAEIVLQLGTSTHDAVARAIEASGTPEATEAADTLEVRLRFQGIAIDRILGLPDGSIVFVEPGFAQAVMAAQR